MKRMAIRKILAPLLLVGACVGACGVEPTTEDVCTWLGNNNNCYAKFAQDVGARCGSFGAGTARKGAFATRDKLDVCVLEEPGPKDLVIFDPPLALDALQTRGASFKIMNADSTLCLSGSVGLGGEMALFVQASTTEPNAGCVDDPKEICGGVFSLAAPNPEGVFRVECPNGDEHDFDIRGLASCPDASTLFPRVELETYAGGVGAAGYVTFRAFYPSSGGGQFAKETATIVEYFTCAIPAAASGPI